MAVLLQTVAAGPSREAAEAVVPDLMDFLNYSVYNSQYKHEFLGAPLFYALRSPLKRPPPQHPILSIGNRYG